MGAPRFEAIAAQDADVQAALRDLNNANARETSFLTDADWAALIAEAFVAFCVADAGALLITFDQNAAYHSANFKWFQARRDRFVYVDRIVVADNRRGEGLAGRLYRELFDRART
ncbi:MAG: GNAT family N-acetyltransferase, partial [Rhodospirillaceae bacterium]|nr:GNAT family N-acetyltransferase [Rhodospirillaceae bacterium]